jgi:hypothetical protein
MSQNPASGRLEAGFCLSSGPAQRPYDPAERLQATIKRAATSIEASSGPIERRAMPSDRLFDRSDG